MGMVSRGDSYSVSHDMANININELTDIVTDRARALETTAENMQSVNEDPSVAESLMQNKLEFKKPVEKAKPPEKTTPTESVFRKEEPKGDLDKELEQHAKNFVEQNKTMKKDSLIGIRKEIENLGKNPTKEQILGIINKSYGKGHEAEAFHAFTFLLETTSGDINKVIDEAKKDFEKVNKPGIEKGLNIEKIATGIAKDDEFKGKESNLNEKFIDLVAMEADVFMLDEKLLARISHEEGNKLLNHCMSLAGEKLRGNLDNGHIKFKTEDSELRVLCQALQALQAYRGVFNQMVKAHPNEYYEHAIAKHIAAAAA